MNFVEKFVRNSFARGDPRCVHKNRVTRGKRSGRGLCSRCKLQSAVYLSTEAEVAQRNENDFREQWKGRCSAINKERPS